MRVAIDLCTFTSIHQGGKDEVAYNLLRGFVNLGRSKDIICFCYPDLADKVKKISNDIDLYIIPKKRIKSRFKLLEVILNGTLNSDLYEEIITEKKVDILVFSNKLSSLASYSIPTVIIPHDIQMFYRGNLTFSFIDELRRLLLRFLVKLEFRKRSSIIAISDFDKKEMFKYLPGIKDKVYRIYNPIIFREYSPFKVNKKHILALNIQHPHKNIVTLIRAFKEIKDVIPYDLVLVGKLPRNMDELLNVIDTEDLSKRVLFTGFVPDDDLGKIISQTRIYVNTSFFEGFGMTAIEMIGQQIPTIVANNTAQKEVTKGFCKYYEPTNDFRALAEVILAEINEPTAEQDLIKFAGVMKASYSYEVIASKYWEFFRQVVNLNTNKF